MTIASVSAKMEESVSGMKEIQSFSREGETRREFRKVNTDNMEANVLAGQVMSAFWPVVAIFTAIGNCLVLWFGGSAGGLFSHEYQYAPWSLAKAWDLLKHLWVPVVVVGAAPAA